MHMRCITHALSVTIVLSRDQHINGKIGSCLFAGLSETFTAFKKCLSEVNVGSLRSPLRAERYALRSWVVNDFGVVRRDRLRKVKLSPGSASERMVSRGIATGGCL